MNIYNIIITAILLIILVCGVIIGIKKGLRRSLLSLASNVIAALAAFWLARLFASALSKNAAKILSDRITSSVSSDTAGMLGLPEISVWYLTVGRVVLSVAVFALFYLAVFLLLKIPVNIIVKKYPAKKGKSGEPKVISPVIRVFSGLMTFVLVISPAAALCGRLDSDRIDSYKYVSAAPAKDITKIARYPVVKAASAAGGGAFFNALTAFDENGVHILPSDEIGYAAEFAFNSYDIFSFEQGELNDTESSLLKIDGALNGSSLLAPSIGAAVPYMASQWLEGKSCMGIKINIPKGRAGTVVRKILEKISGWSAEDVVRDFGLLVELMKLLQSKELNADMSAKELLNAFADREYAKDFFAALGSNPEFRDVLPDLIYSGIGMAMDEIGAKLPDNYDADKVMSSLTKEHIEEEAVIFSDIAASFSDIYRSNGSIKPSFMTADQQTQVKEAISGIKDSHVLDSETSQSVMDALEDVFAEIRK